MERENEAITELKSPSKLKCPNCGSERVWFETGLYGDWHGWHLKCYKCGWYGRRAYTLQEINEEFFGKGTEETQ